MDQASLTSYIAQCRASGFTDVEIHAQLVAAGWAEEQISPFFLVSAPPVQPQPTVLANPVPAEVMPEVVAGSVVPPDLTLAEGPKVKRRLGMHPTKRALLLGVLLAFLLVVIAAIGSVALAEQGHLPVFSRFYRRLNLPLIWKGTVSNSALSIIKIASATVAAPTVQTDSTMTFTVSMGSKKPSVSWGSFFNEQRFADIPAETSDAASLTPDIFSQLASIDPTTLLPVTMTFHSSAETDAQSNSHGTFTIDASDYLKGQAQLAHIFPFLTRPLSAEGTLLPSEKLAYVRSSLIPTLSASDRSKWLKFPVPSDTVTQNRAADLKTVEDQVSGKDKAIYLDLASSALIDQGISREDGVAYAKYALSITPALFTRLSGEAQDATLKTVLTQMGSSGVTITGMLSVEPRSGRLRHLVMDTSASIDVLNLVMTSHQDETITYRTDVAVAAPQPEVVISNPREYFQQVAASPDTANDTLVQAINSVLSAQATGKSSIDAQNSQRKSEVTQVGKAMEVYLNDTSSPGYPPSNGDHFESLQNPDSTLAKLGKAFPLIPALPIKDPDPAHFSYEYKSNGKTYTIRATIVDPADSTKGVTYFEIVDGTSLSIPYTKP